MPTSLLVSLKPVSPSFSTRRFKFWEACTALHNMQAKWLDCGSTMAAFHMQSKHYDKIQPPSFGDHQHLDGSLVIHRDRSEDSGDISGQTQTKDTFESEEGAGGPPSVDNDNNNKTRMATLGGFLKRRRAKKGGANNRKRSSGMSIEMVTIPTSPRNTKLPFPTFHALAPPQVAEAIPPSPGESRRLSMSVCENKNSVIPSLFLQEGAHLVSLLGAVALSTLRCESDDSEATLKVFTPNHHWPHYNSDNDPDMRKFGYRKNGFMMTLQYLFDVSGTKRERREYDRARPFAVIGGVSEREALMLQSTRGGLAKTALVFMWLNEFVIREQMHGSLGGVAPPIVSRLQQYASDGHFWYNAARKMSYIPIPFPHQQLAALFEIISIFLLPVLMLSKTQVYFGFCLNFVTVLLLNGLNELAKEYEHPYRGMPNDLPLNLFQAQFNESIVTMFAGFHPDSWWEMKWDA